MEDLNELLPGNRNRSEICVGYSRLSKEDLDKLGKVDSESIKNQMKLIKEFAEQNNMFLLNIYSDDDFRGSDRNRPEFNRMISDGMQGKFGVVVCKSQSRFARDIELIEKYIHGVFLEKRIRFIALQDHIDTRNMTSSMQKVSQINSLKDAWYIQDLSENVISAFRVKRRDGEYIASWPLYGYQKDPNNKNRLIVDPVAAKIVKEIYTLYTRGNGLTRIARILNERSVPNPLRYRLDQGAKVGGYSRWTSNAFLWRECTIGAMLDNEMYIGTMVQGRFKKVSYKSKKLIRTPEEEWFRITHSHEAIIDEELWNRVRSMRKVRSRPHADGMINLFNGKIRCAECGERMRVGRSPKVKDGIRSKTEYYISYSCSKKAVDPKSCDSNGITSEKVERVVLQQLQAFMKQYYEGEQIESLLRSKDEKEKERQELLNEKERLKRQIEDVHTMMARLYLDRVKGIITEAQFIAVNDKMADENQRALKALARVEGQFDGTNKKEEEQRDVGSIIQNYRTIMKLNRSLVMELIECIYIGKKDKKTKERKIKILWSF